MVDTVHRSRVAECPSFNGTTEQPRKCNVAFSLLPDSFMWKGHWSKFQMTGS